jgi:hypothetical protein
VDFAGGAAGASLAVAGGADPTWGSAAMMRASSAAWPAREAGDRLETGAQGRGSRPAAPALLERRGLRVLPAQH